MDSAKDPQRGGMDGKGMLEVAYVISMPHGLDAWTYRELEALSKGGVGFTILPLRYAPGPLMPKREWDCYRWSRGQVAVRQLVCFIERPLLYARLLAEAIQTRTVIDLMLAIDFAGLMRVKRTGIIHCVFGDHKLFIGYYCKKLLGIPLTVALYGYDLRANPNWGMFKRAIRAANLIIVNCDFNKKLLTEIVGQEVGARARVVRHYAEIPTSVAADKLKILIVGGFVERKGHDVLFKAIAALGEDADKIEIWVAGYPGPVDVAQLAIECGVNDKVRVFGSVGERGLDYLFEACDIFCLPSKTDVHGISEGLPVALIEAMAHGKPVISTRLAGIPELVNEVLVEEGDVAGLARAIRRVAGDPELRRCMGAKNLEMVRSGYSKKNVLLLRDLWIEQVSNGPSREVSCAQGLHDRS